MEQLGDWIERQRYDAVCVQELWLKSDLETLAPEGRWAWAERQVLDWWIPGSKGPSGLATLHRHTAPKCTRSVRYRATSANKGDFLVTKGAMLTRWDFGWLCTTHTDAGGEDEDLDAREDQLETLAKKLSFISEEPLIVAGDLNLKRTRCWDDAMYTRFLDDTGLSQWVGGPLDYALARGLTGSASWLRIPTDSNGEDLSDHAPIELTIQ